MSIKTPKRLFLFVISTLFLGAGLLYAKATFLTLNSALISKEGKTVIERIKTPPGFERAALDTNSFGYFLRNSKLLAHGSPVKLHDGTNKWNQNIHAAVLDVSVGKKDLQQCADAVMRLRADFLWNKKKYTEISFNFTNGFKADYIRWANGERIKVDGNKVSWYNGAAKDYSYENFLKYLERVFMYAGTLSLEKQLQKRELKELTVGDVFIRGGSPGHAMIVVDVAINKKGDKIFLLAQSYMPAQSIHIVKNNQNSNLSPWFKVSEETKLYTPEWIFEWNQLKRW